LSTYEQSGKMECSPSNRRAIADSGRQLNFVLGDKKMQKGRYST